jgi:hypothetical protein
VRESRVNLVLTLPSTLSLLRGMQLVRRSISIAASRSGRAPSSRVLGDIELRVISPRGEGGIISTVSHEEVMSVIRSFN